MTVHTFAVFIVTLLRPLLSLSSPDTIGVVLLHGKQGSPSHVRGLAGDLRSAGYRVATP